MLNEISVSIDDLLLDPNNPRFICGLEVAPKIADEQLEQKQAEVLKEFGRKAKGDDPKFDVTNIKDLYDSMLRIGFVGIDRPVVRSVKGSKKFLVLEGNRRVATVKTILGEYESKQIKKDEDRKSIQSHMDSFKTLTVMQLETDGMSEDQVAHRISIILGLRHHGSLLSWGPLPRACNIYSEYLEASPDKSKFSDNTIINEVASRLCITPPKVKDALRTYIAYLQLTELFPDIQDDFFTLIEAGIKDTHLMGSYFISNPETFRLDDASAAKFNAVCQFSTRDSKNTDLTSDGKKKILPTPKHFGMLGKLVAKMQSANHPALKNFANSLILRVENEDDLETTVEQAMSELIDFENRTKWAEAVAKLLDVQEKELDLSQYSGDGNDRGQKDELLTTMAPLRAIMKI